MSICIRQLTVLKVASNHAVYIAETLAKNMRNRIVGILIIGIAVVFGFVVFSFNQALLDAIGASCSHGPSCSMWGSIEFQTNASLAIIAFIVLIGIYLIFFSKEEKIVMKIKRISEQKKPKITKDAYRKILGGLNNEEKTVLEKIIESNGYLPQRDLMDATNLNKVKITRILDRLEGRGIIERKRRGMSNIILLK